MRGKELLILALAPALLATQAIGGVSKYEAMVEEIGGLLTEALGRYKKGNVQEAKTKTQAAYFEVFENLEGPIRVNISAQANYELEEEFSTIRRMILRQEPAGAIEKRITAFMQRLQSIVPDLEAGVELVAEASDAARDQSGAAAASQPGGIEPVWLVAFENIQTRLGLALEAYKSGDADKAATLVNQAFLGDYTTSLLEVAIRGNISQGRNFEHSSAFSDIEEMIKTGKDPAGVAASAASLVEQLRKDLPGLPLVEGAASKRIAPKQTRRDAAGVTTMAVGFVIGCAALAGVYLAMRFGGRL